MLHLFERATFSRIFCLAAITFALFSSPAPAQANDPPEILSFGIVEIGYGYWVAYGFVDDEYPETCRVDFGGPLAGYATDVNSNGEFALVLDLAPGIAGIVSAVATDAQAATSNTAYDFLGNY